MENKPVLWVREDDSGSTTLRQPRGTVLRNSPHSSSLPESNVQTNKNVKEEQTKNIGIEELVAKSNLKAEAPEWYPSGHVSNNLTNNCTEALASSIQNRLKIHKKNENESSGQFQSTSDDDYSSDIRRLEQIITTLTKDPGQFDDLLDVFLETLIPYLNDIIALSVIANLLVEQGINNANFRYTGARLCWYIEQNCPEFRAELHMRCKKQIGENINSQNVLLFIAELYTQLPHLTIFGDLLIEVFKRLFEKGGDNNIKSICQALKLTGYLLEQSNKTDLDGVFDRLKSVQKSVSGSAAIVLQSVLNLRSDNWGHLSEGSESEQEPDSFLYGGEPTRYFYTEGEALTNEENDFIAAHMTSHDDILSDTSDPDELYDPEAEMDEEIQEAFKEFVKLSSKH